MTNRKAYLDPSDRYADGHCETTVHAEKVVPMLTLSSKYPSLARRAFAMLDKWQWGAGGRDPHRCPECNAYPKDGHSDRCEIGSIVAAAKEIG